MKRKILDYLKIMVGCERCGYNENADGLVFHHTGGDKKFNVGSTQIGLKKALTESKKCDILCGTCHLLIHAEERDARHKNISDQQD